VALEQLGTPATPTFGLDTFGDRGSDVTGRPVGHPEAIRQVVAEAQLADQLGLDFFGVGEHHRDDFAISAPDVVLAAIAGSTDRIRLGTSVTVLSSDDPVRVYERFATLDALSGGRAEVTLGRGSFTESFPLFGFRLEDYEVLFAEKLDLFAQLLREEPVTWQGTTRLPLSHQRVYPPTASGRLPAWIGVGGTPQSVLRAATYAMPLVIAVIGGSPAQFAPLADLYRKALSELGHEPLPISMHSPGHVAETDEQAVAEHFPHHSAAFTKIGRERGWGPLTRSAYDSMLGPTGALFVGSPETVAQKVAWAVRMLGLSRFQMKYSVGAQPNAERLSCIRLYAEQVVPRVRELLEQETPEPARR
jgi:probable LLM family oxidoreductase